jgi:hypothetical protein
MHHTHTNTHTIYIYIYIYIYITAMTALQMPLHAPARCVLPCAEGLGFGVVGCRVCALSTTVFRVGGPNHGED